MDQLVTLNGWSTTTAYNGTTTLGYNPAGQVVSEVRGNDAFAWTGYANASRSYTANGLNQYGAVGSASLGYDANGNLTSDGSRTYTYDVEDRTRRQCKADAAVPHRPKAR